MEAIEIELESCRSEASTLGKLIQQRNSFFLQREQELSDAISNVASRIRVMESSTAVTQEDIQRCGGDGAVRLANLAERAAEYAVQLRKKREDETLAATAVGRLNEYLTRLQTSIAVPEQLVRTNYRNVAKFRNNVVQRGSDFGADLSPDITGQESFLLLTNVGTGAIVAEDETTTADNQRSKSNTISNNNDNSPALRTTGASLQRSTQAFFDAVNSSMHTLSQQSAYSHEYILALESDLRKMKQDSHEQQGALDEARSVLESTDAVFRTVSAEKDAKAHAVRQLAEQLRRERLVLESAVAAAAEPTRTSSELMAENAKLQRRTEVLHREMAEADSVCSASQQRCEIATDALLAIKEAVQRGLEAKSNALRRKTDMERGIRENQDSVAKCEADIKNTQQRSEATLAEAQHVRDSIAAAADEKDKMLEEEKKVHRQLAKADYESQVLKEQEEELHKRIVAEKQRTEAFTSQQRNCNLERAKLEQEVQLKNESVSSLKNQLQYLRGLLSPSHPLKIL